MDYLHVQADNPWYNYYIYGFEADILPESGSFNPKVVELRYKIGTNFMIDICLRLLYFDTELFYCLAGRFLFDIENYQD